MLGSRTLQNYLLVQGWWPSSLPSLSTLLSLHTPGVYILTSVIHHICNLEARALPTRSTHHC